MRAARSMAWAIAWAMAGFVGLGGCGSARTAPLPPSLQPDLAGEGSQMIQIDDGEDVPGGARVDAGDAPAAMDAAPAPALSANVRLSIRSSPRALVSWGRKHLGVTPLTVQRPRDSGPMDLVLRADHYLTLHTRAYTFRNDSLSVDLVHVSKQDSVLGARKATPDGGALPDAGAP